MAYQIFADATADLIDHFAAELSSVRVIPMQVDICGRSFAFGPEGNLTTADFYKMQREGNYASTSQINPATYIQYFSSALLEGKDVLYFSFSSGMSATYQSAQMAAQELQVRFPDRKILCVDTLGATLSEMVLIQEAARMQQNGADLESVAEWVEKNRLNVCVWFVVDTFDHLHHGGRVSTTVAVVGTMLSIKPMLHIDSNGRLENTDKPRGRKKAMAALISKMDQGMMFGYACNEIPQYMPLAIQLANELTKRLTYVRRAGILTYLRPDGKSQVTVEYMDGKPSRVDAVVISFQHDPEVSIEQLRDDILETVFLPVIPDALWDFSTKIYINPTGRFVLGGPAADTGLTGRKIIADTYGGYARHGGGAFSGKDPTKVDRSAAYMARFVAKHIVAAGLAEKCEIQLSYAIGVARPVSIMVDTFGTSKVPEDGIQSWISENIDLRPGAIIDTLNLRRPIYEKTAAYGHFGRPEFPWEQLNSTLLADLRTLL